MKVLVLKGCGHVGRSLCKRLEKSSLDFVVEVMDEASFCDAEYLQAVFAREQPTIVVNCFVYRDRVEAEQQPERAYEINRDALGRLAVLCQMRDAALVHISSYLVFDGTKDGPYTERDMVNPQGVLATSCWQGEEQVRQLCPEHIILRLGWTLSNNRHSMLHQVIEELKNSEPIIVVEDRIGSPTPVADAARVLVAILEQLDCSIAVWGTYHYGGIETVSESDLADAVVRDVEIYDEIAPDQLQIISSAEEEQMSQLANGALDCTKLTHTFGVMPRNWRGGLAKMVKGLYV